MSAISPLKWYGFFLHEYEAAWYQMTDELSWFELCMRQLVWAVRCPDHWTRLCRHAACHWPFSWITDLHATRSFSWSLLP